MDYIDTNIGKMTMTADRPRVHSSTHTHCSGLRSLCFLLNPRIDQTNTYSVDMHDNDRTCIVYIIVSFNPASSLHKYDVTFHIFMETEKKLALNVLSSVL